VGWSWIVCLSRFEVKRPPAQGISHQASSHAGESLTSKVFFPEEARQQVPTSTGWGRQPYRPPLPEFFGDFRIVYYARGWARFEDKLGELHDAISEG
jgi:hypothetical protein